MKSPFLLPSFNFSRKQAELQFELFLEIAVEFDGGPVALTNIGRIFQHRHMQIPHTLQFDFAPSAGSGLGDQGVDAAAVEQLDPQAQHAVGATKLLAKRAARKAQACQDFKTGAAKWQ